MTVAALSCEPFVLWYAAQQNDIIGTPVAAYRNKLTALSPAAKRAGLHVGQSLRAAKERVSNLTVIPEQPHELTQAWLQLSYTLFTYSPDVEIGERGVAWLVLDVVTAHQLADDLNARVGLASSKHLARLASFMASPGEVYEPRDESTFWSNCPVYFLRPLGLSSYSATRLQWLGITTIGHLQRWSRTQARAFFKAEADTLLPYIHATNSRIHPTALPQPITIHLDVPDLIEPGDIDAALSDLAQRFHDHLNGKSCSQLTLTTTSHGLSFTARRTTKHILIRPAEILRLALRLFEDSQATGFTIDELALTTTDAKPHAFQGSLFAKKEKLATARTYVTTRIPNALVTLQQNDPHSLIPEHQWHMGEHISENEVDRETVERTPRGNRRTTPDRQLQRTNPQRVSDN